MALYPSAVKRLIPPGPNDPRIKARLVILHVDASNATSLYDYFNGPSGGVESHFFVKKDGTVEQYRDTGWQADANTAANDFAISIETQGYAAGEWTDAQLSSIRALLLWCNTTHGIPLAKCPTWDGSGVGYHNLFATQWAGGPRACPGPDRIKQFNNVLVPWMANPQEVDVPLTQAEIDAVAVAAAGQVWNRFKVHGAAGDVDLQTALSTILQNASPDKIAAAVVAKLPPAQTGQVDTAALATAVVNELATRGLAVQILGKA